MSSRRVATDVLAGLVAAGRMDEAIDAVRSDLAGMERSFTRLLPSLERIPHASWRARTDRKQRIVLPANSTTHFLARALSYAMAFRGVWVTVREAPFDGWERELVDPSSSLGREPPDVIVLWLSSLGLSAFGTQRPTDIALRVSRAVGTYRIRSSVPIVMLLPEALEEEHDPHSPAGRWRRTLHDSLAAELAPLQVDLASIDSVIAHIGQGAWRPGRYWIAAKTAHHPDAAFALADLLTRSLLGFAGKTVKLVVTDLDDTLWGGSIGELGWDGVRLEAHGEGAGSIRLQRYLLDLRARGVLLAICSKNDVEDVRQAFERRPEMLMRLADFAEVVVDWRPKSQSIPEICRRLGLSLAGVAFLDDSPLERAEVRALLPDVLVPELPSDSTEFVGVMANLPEFAVRPSTAEDAARSGYYDAERERQSSARTFASLDDYHRSLGMTLRPMRVDSALLERAVQLVQKVNQFNLTMRRPGRAELEALVSSERNYAFAYRVADRFGDHGVTGLLFATPIDSGGARYLIALWLQSCRVMGRTVERAALEHLLGWLRDRGCAELVGEFVPGPRNAVVRHLYPELGFAGPASSPEGTERYALDPRSASARNLFVKVLE